VQGAALVVAVATPGGDNPIDVGRAMQNMMLVAWNDGVVSCPNGMPDAAAAASALGLEGDLQPVNILSFGYPRRELDPDSKSPEEWAREANRRPLEEVVKRV
jgi:nitroreductase